MRDLLNTAQSRAAAASLSWIVTRAEQRRFSFIDPGCLYVRVFIGLFTSLASFDSSAVDPVLRARKNATLVCVRARARVRPLPQRFLVRVAERGEGSFEDREVLSFPA